MIEQYGEDSTVARVEVMGEFPSADDDTVIPMDLVKAAVDRDVSLAANSPIIWGLDVARFGGDNSALCVRQGNHVMSIKSFKSMDLMQLCGVIKSEMDDAKDFIHQVGAERAESTEYYLGTEPEGTSSVPR